MASRIALQPTTRSVQSEHGMPFLVLDFFWGGAVDRSSGSLIVCANYCHAAQTLQKNHAKFETENNQDRSEGSFETENNQDRSEGSCCAQDSAASCKVDRVAGFLHAANSAKSNSTRHSLGATRTTDALLSLWRRRAWSGSASPSPPSPPSLPRSLAPSLAPASLCLCAPLLSLHRALHRALLGRSGHGGARGH
eukprot:3083005-Rhodomonas_salina.2